MIHGAPQTRRLATATVVLHPRGLLSTELAAGIRRVKGVRLAVRLGNWLTSEQGRLLLGACTCRRFTLRAAPAHHALFHVCF
jgi:hypothetical protein